MTAGLLLPCAAHAAPEAVDPSSVKGVAVAFTRALSAGDTKAIRASAVGDDEHFAAVDALAALLQATAKFRAATESRFGPGNPLANLAGGGVPDLAADAAAADYRIEGDRAWQRDRRLDSRMQMQLVRHEGGWRVDLRSVTPDPAVLARRATAAAKVFTDAAAEIAAGTYLTADAAAKAIGPRLLAAIK
jgi:hypothetical protein